MNQSLSSVRWFSPPFFFFLLFIIFFLTEPALSIDPRFGTCVPKSCSRNGLEIRYPFWIDDEQPSYCGYPGFKLTCRNDEPVLDMIDAQYIVRSIFYKGRTLSVVNAELLANPCPFPLNNLTFNRTPFNISPVNYNLSILNCSTLDGQQLQGLNYFPVSCLSNHTIAVWDYPGDSNRLDLSKTCENSATVPLAMESYKDLAERNYSKVLQKGFLLNWTAMDCSRCNETGGQCGYNESISLFQCFCADRPHRKKCIEGGDDRPNLRRKTIIGISAGLGVFFLLLCFCCCKAKCSPYNYIFISRQRRYENRKVEAFLRNYGSFAPKRYRYSELKKITNSFKDKLGQGGFGGVYKGKFSDNRLVAVKLLNSSKGNGEDFINEVASIGRTYHVNVVSLLGFCYEGSKRALIYEFMPNGSLEKFIYCRNSGTRHHLGCEKLFQIAVGIARGLEYLHRGCSTRILHFDIKPHNILLDDDFCPKISDFGLAKICRKQESMVSMLEARGTVGYIAPEVFCRSIGTVSYKSDVYSYGMMILEMVGGRKNIDTRVENTSEIYFPHWVYERISLKEGLGLSGNLTQGEEEIAKKMILVGLWCIQTNPAIRPSMSRVVEMLDGSLEVLQMPPKPYLSSPSRPPSHDLSTAEIS